MIPAIDLLGGRCVRLTRGSYADETVYADEPAAVAREWVRQGARRLHVVDLDGAREGRPVNLPAITEITAAAGVPVQVGGGVRSVEHADTLLDAGVSRLVVGTRALREEGFLRRLAERYAERVIVSLDVRDGRLAVSGWLEEIELTLDAAAARLVGMGMREAVVTDVSRDGTLEGINADLVERVARHGLAVIAAGGVGSVRDIERLRELEPLGVAGVIIGKALYEGRLTLAEALAAAGPAGAAGGVAGSAAGEAAGITGGGG